MQGWPTAWFAPTYKNLAETWRGISQVLKEVTLRCSQTEHRLELVGGGSLDMWSLDHPDVARGRKYAEVVIDEAAIVPNMGDAWQLTIRPCLTDLRGGAWFFSTPRGMNAFKALWDKGQDPMRPSWASWQMPTSENPRIAPEEIEDYRRDSHELAFAQEYMAQFVSWEGAVFRHVGEAAIALPQDGPIESHEYVFGVDWGRSLDYTVVVVLDAVLREVVAMERWGTVDYAVQRGRLAAMCQRWRPSAILAESNSMGQPIIEQLYRDGMPVQPFLTTNASKALAVEGLALAFERGDIRIIPDPELLAELQAFQAERLPSGLMRYCAPAGQHDDCVMALVIAWSAIEPYAPQTQVLTYEDRVHISRF